MYYEKWGFMLIFWNMAGVPLSYCHCTIHLANHAPSTYRWNRAILAFLFSSYLFMYWIWDTTGSQKSRFKQMEHGGTVQRNKWIELPWQTLKNPQTITSEKGDKILVDGWCQYSIFLFHSPSKIRLCVSCMLRICFVYAKLIDSQQINTLARFITPATSTSLCVGV